jgi:glutamate synthase domain-containing protein 3
MSGGVAYVLDARASFARLCNPEFVDLEPLDRDEDVQLVMELLTRHVRHTGSSLAARLLTDWSATAKLFVKVMPRDYKRVLTAIRNAEESGTDIDEAMCGNICRCGTYSRIRQAIHRAAELKAAGRSAE